MDVKVEIKEEVVWIEETASTSLDSCVNNTASNDSVVKVEPQTSFMPKVQNDALEPKSQEDLTLPSAEIKDELLIEEPTVDPLAPCFKEDNVEISGILIKSPVFSCSGNVETINDGHINPQLPIQFQGRLYCSVCSKSFDKKSHFERHQRIHSGEKPYHCSICGSTFTENGTLQSHLRTHTGERPYSCSFCSQSFSLSSTLKSHLRTHTGERPYSCTECSQTFSVNNNLRRHLRTHFREKPYQCTDCDSTFSDKRRFEAHLRKHSGEKPYSCSLCGKSFSLRSRLNRHLRIHSGLVPYLCSVQDAAISENETILETSSSSEPKSS